jgi:uncharacterized protein HemX
MNEFGRNALFDFLQADMYQFLKVREIQINFFQRFLKAFTDKANTFAVISSQYEKFRANKLNITEKFLARYYNPESEISPGFLTEPENLSESTSRLNGSFFE